MNTTARFYLPTEPDTQALAFALARFAVPGDVLRLYGDLGAGKSTFARAFIKGLGSKAENIPSPTYTLVQSYTDTRVPVLHIDCYRLNAAEELQTLGLEADRPHSLCLVEWPEKAGDAFNPPPGDPTPGPAETDACGTLDIAFSETAEGGRQANITAHGGWVRRVAMAKPELRRTQSDAARKDFLTSIGQAEAPIVLLAADASFRQYYRVQTPEGDRVLMDAPSPLEEVMPYVNMARYLKNVGLRAPRIDEVDEEKGYLLEEDFGNTKLLTLLQNGAPIAPWYKAAVDVLMVLAKAHPAPFIPVYTPDMLWAEAARFADWYIPHATGNATPPAERQRFFDAWQPLFDKILAVPKTTTLWDFHAANLMVLSDTMHPTVADLGLLDFQDARLGPITYDLSMLLQDARVSLLPGLQTELINHVVDGLGVDMQTFMTSYRLVSLQRTLKIIGGFTRLALRDGKTQYLNHLPRCWGLVAQSLAHPDCAPLEPLLTPYLQQALQKAA